MHGSGTRWWRGRRALLAVLALLVLLMPWLLRDALAARLLRASLVGRLAEAGWLAEVDLVEVRVPADLSPAAVRLQGVRLRARTAGCILPQAELDEVRATIGVRALLGGETTGPWEVDGARVQLDLSARGMATEATAWPESLPDLRVRGLHLRAPLAGEAALELRESTLDWRAGLAGGELRGELLGGSARIAGRLQRDARGGRFVGELQARELRLDLLAAAAGTPGLQPVLLAAAGTVDVPLETAGLRELLAEARAELQIGLRRVDTEDEVAVGGRLAGGVLELSSGSARTRGGSLQLSAGRLELDADWLDTRLQLAGRADVTDLQPLGALLAPLLATAPGGLAPAGWGGSLVGNVQAAGTLRDPSFDLEVTGRQVLVAGWRLGDVRLSATGDRRSVRLESCELRSNGGELDVHGELDVEARVLREVVAEVRLAARGAEPAEEPPDEVLPALSRPWLPAVLGEITLRVRADGPLDEPRLALDATLQDARVSAAGRVTSPPWARPAGSSPGLHVDELRVGRGELDLELQQPAVLSLGDCAELTAVELRGSAGAARLALSGAPLAEGRLRSELVAGANGLSLALLPASLRPGGLLADELQLELRLAWTVAAAGPTSTGCGGLAEAEDLDLHLDLVLLQPGLGVGGLHGARLVVRGDLAGDPQAPRGRLEVDAEDLQLALPAALAEALGALEGGGEVEIDRTDMSESALLVDAGGRMREPSQPAPDGAPRRLQPGALALRLTCGERVVLEALHLTGAGALSVEASGWIGAPLDLRAAAAGGSALRADAPLQLEARLAAVDIAHVREWLGEVRRMSGELQAEVQVAGTWHEPVVTGRAQLRDGVLRLASGIPPLEALQAELQLGPDEARIVRCTGELGAMPFELSGGVRLGGGDPACDLRLRGQNLLVWRGQGVKVRSDVDLALSGPLRSPVARGWLRLRDSLVVRAVDVLELAQVVPAAPDGAAARALRDSALARLRLDVAISAAEPVRIENNIVRGELLPDLRVTGTGETPVPEGELQILSTRIVLPASVLHLTHGRLLFDAADPRRPVIDLHGETHVRGHDVTLRATGPYDEPELELASSPPLSSEEVLLLVLTGQPPSGAPPGGLAGASGVTAVYLGQDLLARWLTDTAGDEEGPLDRFEFGYAEDVTTHGSTLVQVSYHLLGDLPSGRPALYLHAEKDPWDAVNFGLRWRVTLR